MNSGKINFLHGASSSGKTTLAKLLQQKIEEPFWHISIDHLRDAGVLPLNRYRSGEFDWKKDREAFFEGFHISLQAYIQAGNNLIIEHIIETSEWKKLLMNLFADVDMFFVGVHCPLDELERREAQRSDRPGGDARRDFETIHEGNAYDFNLDATLSPDSNVKLLIDAWSKRGESTFWNQ